MYNDRTALEDAFHVKAPLNFLFFWGHQPSKDGTITSSCLSQWWPSQFEVEGTVYFTAEHWMMSQKAQLFGDYETAIRIRAARSPKEVKQLGREARGFDAAIWDANKFAIVEEGNFHKFCQNTELLNFLTATGDLVLVEASPVDCIWGIGLTADDANAANPPEWRGENLLGFALMRVRQRLCN